MSSPSEALSWQAFVARCAKEATMKQLKSWLRSGTGVAGVAAAAVLASGLVAVPKAADAQTYACPPGYYFYAGYGCYPYSSYARPTYYYPPPPAYIAPAPVVVAPTIGIGFGWGWHGGWHRGGWHGGGWHR
jgi:hypothetical protein